MKICYSNLEWVYIFSNDSPKDKTYKIHQIVIIIAMIHFSSKEGDFYGTAILTVFLKTLNTSSDI